jgi:polyhydroxyalkanoate synthesis repressor PhaR
MTEPKIIKRYANRKLYDTERSCYVTLDEIAQMIKEGEELRVIDNKSKSDLTAVTFAQIIFEEEKKVAKMPLMLLRGIIQNSGDAIGDFFQRRVSDPVSHLREDVERRANSLFKRDREDEEAEDEEGNKAAESGAEEAGRPLAEGAADSSAAPVGGTDGRDQASTAPEGQARASDQSDADDDEAGEHQKPVRAFVASTTEAFENWQKRIDERVQGALSAMTHLTHVGADMDVLKARLQRLEERLDRVEPESREGESA